MGERLARVDLQEVEPVARRLGKGLLVGKDLGRALRVDPQRPDDAVGGTPVGTGHAVGVEGGFWIVAQRSLVLPLGPLARGVLVAVEAGPVVGLGQLDPYGVRAVAAGEPFSELRSHDVVRRRDHGAEVDPPGVVANAAEWLEARHAHCVAHRHRPSATRLAVRLRPRWR